MFGEAYGKAATVTNAVKGFRACGIEPFNAHIFGEEDFAPAATSERAYNSSTNVTNAELAIYSDFSSDDDVPLVNLKNKHTAGDSARPHMHQTPTKRQLFPSESEPGPSCSKSQAGNSLWQMRPLPSMNRPISSKRRKLTSSIISSTPVKKQLEEKATNIAKKDERKQNKSRKKEKDSILSYCCLMCEEPYEDPPTEEWLQCYKCLNWCHEECTAYEGSGQFICDICL